MQQIFKSFLLFTAFEAKVHTKVTCDFGFTQAHQRILAVAIQVSPLVGIVYIGQETVEFPALGNLDYRILQKDNGNWNHFKCRLCLVLQNIRGGEEQGKLQGGGGDNIKERKITKTLKTNINKNNKNMCSENLTKKSNPLKDTVRTDILLHIVLCKSYSLHHTECTPI
jgi:hypothetical protein